MEEKMFKDREHWNAFTDFISKMKCADVYHVSLAYLLTLDRVTRTHINDLFDFEDDSIKADGFNWSWQTGTSRKVTRLAFNLWNGYYFDGETYVDDDGYISDLPSANYNVDVIFDCDYAPYFVEAIKLRYPHNFAEVADD